MRLFDNKGIMVIPAPERKEPVQKELIVIRECFCPNGHNLVDNHVKFNNRSGIVLGVKKKRKEGKIALSPVFGDKSKISIDIDINDGELLDLYCPDCGASLLSYTTCECGGDILVMFTKPEPDFQNCIGICNRVGCIHAEIKNEGQLMTLIQ